MSWEEMNKKEVKCPCKKGVATLTTYGDDWNRFRESASIECPECKKKYGILHHSNVVKIIGDSYRLKERSEYLLNKKQ